MRIFRLIHFSPQLRLSPRILHGAECGFWFVLALALAFGGRTALAGLPVLAGDLLPLMQRPGAEESYPAHQLAALPMTEHRSEAGPADSENYAGVDMARVANATAAFGQHPAGKVIPVPSASHGMPAIALVIDDLGPDVARTRRVMALPDAVAMSFLPYGEQTPALAVAAERAGHDVLAHVPMQPLGHENPGPMVLKPGQSPREITRRLKWDLVRVPGLIGINNHMGSRFTQDRKGLMPVMQLLMTRNLFFFDSVTAPHSKAMHLARAFGLLSASRDVFLDDTVSAKAVAHQLKILEHIARHEGIALAIGHPHDVTLDALEKWCAHLQGFQLVRIRDGLRMKTERDMGVPVAALSRPAAR